MCAAGAAVQSLLSDNIQDNGRIVVPRGIDYDE